MLDCERFWAGSPAYFATLVGAFGPLVLTVTRSYGVDIDHAEDLSQEVWKRVFEKRLSYTGTGRFDAWVRRLAVNVCIGDHRARKARREAMNRYRVSVDLQAQGSRPESPLQRLENEDRQILAVRALGLLTDRQREVIEMKVFDHLSSREIAKRLRIRQVTVRTNMRRGIARIRRILEKENP